MTSALLIANPKYRRRLMAHLTVDHHLLSYDFYSSDLGRGCELQFDDATAVHPYLYVHGHTFAVHSSTWMFPCAMVWATTVGFTRRAGGNK